MAGQPYQRTLTVRIGRAELPAVQELRRPARASSEQARADDSSVVLELITRTTPGLDANELRSEFGRMILTADALHFVHGWERVDPIRNGYTPFRLIDEFQRRWRTPHWPDGVRLLAEVAHLEAAEQVRTLSGSFSVPVADVESATVGALLGDLDVVTASRGERLHFLIPRRYRARVRAWVTRLPDR